jgi:hypothetical protein
MKRWKLIRHGLRAIGVGLSTAGLPLVEKHPWAGSALLVAGAALGFLTVDLPRDPWTKEELEAYRKRARRSTRQNPLMGFLLRLKGARGVR